MVIAKSEKIHSESQIKEDNSSNIEAYKPSHRRLEMLDGWRAISILVVMSAHMLPLGPKSWELNGSVAALGMAIFFTLSGFLVVSILLRNQNIVSFAIKRIARIVPLAWIVLIFVLAIAGAGLNEWCANLFFYANIPPFYLSHAGHFWSLSVEMQFYAAVGLVVALAGKRGLWIVPIASIIVTIMRIVNHAPITIVTWFRIDEILAGGSLAIFMYTYENETRRWITKVPFLLVVALFLLSANNNEYIIGLNYIRPYLAAMMVGFTIARSVPFLSFILISRPARYIATISYALYIFHPFTMSGWLGSGDRIVRYAKRPISFALTFAAAHFSTYYYEGPINRWAHRISTLPETRKGRRSFEG